MKLKEKGGKVGLKLNIQETKIVASSPIISVQFSRSVMSDSLRPHESQHARPPCPSPTSSPITSWQIDGEIKSLQMVIAAIKLKDACSLKEKL